MVQHPRPSEELTHNGVVLRKYRADDGPVFLRLVERNAARLSPHFPTIMRSVRSPSEAAQYVRERIKEWELGLAYFYAVCDRAGGQLGQVRLKSVDWTTRKAEVAYFIDLASEGRHLMSAALQTLTTVAFGELGLAKVYARVTPANEQSWRLLERLGFTKEGLLRQDFRTTTGELGDVYYYGLLGSDPRPAFGAPAPPPEKHLLYR